MKRDLSPERVALRLARLRSIFIPETLEDARRRPREKASPSLSPPAVAQRLAELRALLELTAHFHARRSKVSA
jgi:predicted component of type VI protein secretion system